MTYSFINLVYRSDKLTVLYVQARSEVTASVTVIKPVFVFLYFFYIASYKMNLLLSKTNNYR